MTQTFCNASHNASYRADIDGLRTIAVIAVILHHLHVPFFTGGFIGVDIFFVISGYLITGQILKSIQTDSFSIKDFYKRRINRIIPALWVVTFVTLIAGFFIVSPSDYIKLAYSAIFSYFGISNVFFWQNYGGYFSSNAGEAPLLHTWSLGVEEQFYFIFPLIMVLAYKLFKHKGTGLFLVVLAVGGLAFSELAITYSKYAGYYLLPMRFFELMMGSVLAVYSPLLNKAKPAFLNHGLAVLGLGLILGSMFLLDDKSPFPGLNAFWPCLGAVLLMYAGSSRHILTPIMTSSVMVGCGLVSYSLYLWHWPLIAYANYKEIALTPVLQAGIMAVCLLLAVASYRFIETPFRKSGMKLAFKHVFIERFLLPLGILGGLCAGIILTNGVANRFDPKVAQFEKVTETHPEDIREKCHSKSLGYSRPINETCALGVENQKPTGILLGDSFANHFTGMLDVLAKGAGVTLNDYTMDGCHPLKDYHEGDTPSYAERCFKRNEIAYTMLKEKQYSFVILGANWRNSQAVATSLKLSIDYILNAGTQKVFLLLPNYEIKNANTCAIRSLMDGTQNACTTQRASVPLFFGNLINQYQGKVELLDPNTALCQGETCVSTLKGVPIYRDDKHLNDIGSRILGETLLEQGGWNFNP